MKLYMIFYLSNMVVMSAGPLPYDMAECKERAAEHVTEIAKKDTKGELTGLDVKCELHSTRPQLGT